MAHADIFQKLAGKPSKNANFSGNSRQTVEQRQETGMDSKLIETVKLLGRQIIEVREIIENQNQTIEVMKNEIIALRKKQTDMNGNIDLAMIDQKDLAKQFRILRATVTGEQIASSRMNQGSEEISKRFFNNYDSSPLFENKQSNGFDNISADTKQSAGRSWKSLDQRTNTAVVIEKSMQTENVAKEFIFGRLPKLLNLE